MAGPEYKAYPLVNLKFVILPEKVVLGELSPYPPINSADEVSLIFAFSCSIRADSNDFLAFSCVF